jgi:hypothetical protein
LSPKPSREQALDGRSRLANEATAASRVVPRTS